MYSAGEMSEISVTINVDAIFPVTSKCGCNANVRKILVKPYSPSDKTTYMLAWSIECRYLAACSFTPALPPPPLPSIVTV